MAKLLRLTFIDFRFLLKAKELWLAMAVVVLYTCSLFLYTINSNEQRTVDSYYQIINDLSFYITILVPALSLAKDYAFKTTRMLYTGPYSKVKVVSSKFLSVLIFYFIVSILHRIGANSLWLIDQRIFSFELLLNELPKTIGNYLTVGMFICMFAFFITLLTYSRMATVIVILVTFIVEKYLRGILLLLFPNEYLKLILTHNPFAISFKTLQYNTIALMDSFIVISTTIILGIVTFTILRRKEMN